MATANLDAKVRSDRGTGVARKLRQSGQVPAIIYGHSRQPQSLAIDTRELEKLLERVAAASTVIELSIDGRSARTLIREIQRHPSSQGVRDDQRRRSEVVCAHLLLDSPFEVAVAAQHGGDHQVARLDFGGHVVG